MDIGFNPEAWISLCPRFLLHNKTNIECSCLSTKRKALGTRREAQPQESFINWSASMHDSHVKNNKSYMHSSFFYHSLPCTYVKSYIHSSFFCHSYLCIMSNPICTAVCSTILYYYYCYYHFYSIYETGQKSISQTKMNYLNLEKKLMKVDKYI